MKVKDDISKLLIVMCFIILLLTSCHLPGSLENINKYASLIIALGIAIYYIYIYIYTIVNKKYKISKISILFIFYLVFLFIDCIFIQDASVKAFFGKYYAIIAVFFLLEINLQKNPKFTILSLEKIFFGLIFVNFITIIIYPDGMYESTLYTQNWFFEYDNTHIFMYLPGLLISALASNYKKSKYNLIYIIMLCMVTYSVYFCFSANTVFVYTLYLIYIIFKKFFDKFDILNASTYFIVYIAIFLIIVVFRFQNIFEVIIVDYLDKDLTFTGRTIIWDRVVSYIQERPWLGYGIEENNIITKKLGNPAFTHAHNTIYDILYKGGIVSLSLFMGIIIVVVKKLYKNRDNPIVKQVSFVLFSAFIMMNFEARQEKVGLYIILVVGYYIKPIIESVKFKIK